MKQSAKKLLMTLEPFAETHAKTIENLVKKLTLEKENKLPQIFADKLATIKNNPLEEKDIVTIFESAKENIEAGTLDAEELYSEILEAVYTIDELNEFTHLNAKDFLNLGLAVVEKIFGFTYEDENNNKIYKEVPSFNGLNPMSYIDRKNFTKELKNNYKIIRDMVIEEEWTEIQKTSFAEYDKKMLATKVKWLEKTGLDIEKMVEWEKNLLFELIKAHVNGEYTPTMGKN